MEMFYPILFLASITTVLFGAVCARSKVSYADCSTNFVTLEQALIKTENNRFRILTAFYPAREAVSVYVDVTYTFQPYNKTDNDTLTEKWIWTAGSFYLIQPPKIFRFTSLFFVYPEEGRIRTLHVTLPGTCRNVTRTRNKKDRNDEGMLEILTQRLRLYARYNSLSSIVADEEDQFLAKAVPIDKVHEIYEENGHHEHYLILVYFTLSIVLPFFALLFFIIVVKSARIHIRIKLTDRKWHPAFASIIALGLGFSMFVVVMDWLALQRANEWNGKTNEHTENNISSKYAFGFIWGTAMTDTVVTVYAVLCFVISLCIGCFHNIRPEKDCTNCHQTCTNISHCFLLCTCFWGKNIGDPHEINMWFLCSTFVAPTMCFGGHSGYIILGWLADPSHGGAVFIIYTLSAFFYFIALRQVYVTTRDRVEVRVKVKAHEQEMKVVLDVEEEFEKRASRYHNSRGTEEFFYPGLFATALAGIGIAGIQVYVTTAFADLPILGVIEDTPLYLLSLFHIGVLVASMVLTYTYLTAEPPVEKDLLRGIFQNVKYYRNQNKDPNETLKPRRATGVEKAAALLGAFMYKNIDDLQAEDEGADGKGADGNGTEHGEITLLPTPRKVQKRVAKLDLDFLEITDDDQKKIDQAEKKHPEERTESESPRIRRRSEGKERSTLLQGESDTN